MRLNCTAIPFNLNVILDLSTSPAEHSTLLEGVYDPNLPMQDKSLFRRRFLCLPNRYDLMCCFLQHDKPLIWWLFHVKLLERETCFRCNSYSNSVNFDSSLCPLDHKKHQFVLVRLIVAVLCSAALPKLLSEFSSK